jgi:low temperature requirement protein LtrA
VNPGEPAEKKVTWAELFFDLVFAFAITAVAGLLRTDHTPAGVARAVIVFVPIYWAWVGVSIHANTHDVDNVLDRLGVFAVGIASLFMALAVPEAYGSRGVLFGASYLAARILLAALVFRSLLRQVPISSFSVALFVTGPLLLIGGFFDGRVRVVLWLLAGVVDLAGPRVLRSRLRAITFEPSHLPERFGLFLIIALGESVVAVGAVAAAGPLTPIGLVTVAAAYTLACGLWWVYFQFAANAVRHAMGDPDARTDVLRSVLSYGHLLFIAGVVAVSVGLSQAVAHPAQRLHPDAVALLYGGTTLYLATFGYTRWRMFHAVSYTRLGAAGLCLVLLPVAPYLPAVGAVILVVAVLVALNVVEARIVRRRRVLPG